MNGERFTVYQLRRGLGYGGYPAELYFSAPQGYSDGSPWSAAIVNAAPNSDVTISVNGANPQKVGSTDSGGNWGSPKFDNMSNLVGGAGKSGTFAPPDEGWDLRWYAGAEFAGQTSYQGGALLPDFKNIAEMQFQGNESVLPFYMPSSAAPASGLTLQGVYADQGTANAIAATIPGATVQPAGNGYGVYMAPGAQPTSVLAGTPPVSTSQPKGNVTVSSSPAAMPAGQNVTVSSGAQASPVSTGAGFDLSSIPWWAWAGAAAVALFAFSK